MKTLNLDDFAIENRVITFKGEDHAVREMCVEDFLNEAQEPAAAVDADVEQTTAQNIERTIVRIRRSIPSMKEEMLRSLTLAQIVVLVQFINGTFDAEVQKGEVASGN